MAHPLHIESAEVCAAEGGWFLPQLFGWMAHVNGFDGETLGSIWGAAAIAVILRTTTTSMESAHASRHRVP